MKSCNGVPFKARVNRNPCVITARDDAVSIEFSEFQKSVEITYDNIRCLQQWKGKVLINAQIDGSLCLFLIERGRAERLYRMVAANIKS